MKHQSKTHRTSRSFWGFNYSLLKVLRLNINLKINNPNFTFFFTLGAQEKSCQETYLFIAGGLAKVSEALQFCQTLEPVNTFLIFFPRQSNCGQSKTFQPKKVLTFNVTKRKKKKRNNLNVPKNLVIISQGSSGMSHIQQLKIL